MMENLIQKLELLIQKLDEKDQEELIKLLEVLLSDDLDKMNVQLKIGWATETDNQEKHGSIFFRIVPKEASVLA